MVCGCVIMVWWMCHDDVEGVSLPRIMLGCII